jgi:NitT/TauT family transport system substrate-binding protein
MTRQWTRRPLLAALLLAPAIAPARAEPATLIVQAGSSVPSVVYLPIYVAEAAGFFAKAGVKVDLRYTNGGPLAVQLVANGNADLAHIVWQPAIQASLHGAKGKFVYGTYTRSSFFVAVPPDSPIKSSADLAGKRVGVFNMASPGLFLVRSMLRSAGQSPGAVTFFPVGLGAQALTALTSGRVDALALWDSEYANYAAIGHELRYIMHPVLGKIGNGGFYASDAAIAEKKTALAGFCKALAEGTAYLLANPESALRMYWQVAPGAKPPGTDAEALQKGLVGIKFVSQTFDIHNRPDGRFGAIDPADLQRIIDALHTEGEIPTAPEADTLVDNEFIAAANDFDRKAVVEPR